MNFSKALITAAVLVASASTAHGKTFDCRVTKSNADYVPQRLIIQYNESTGDVTVNDPVIQHFLGRPTNGEVVTDNGKRTTFKWSINGTTTSVQQNVNLRYRATIMKGSNRLAVSAKPLGYTNNWRGDGACKVK